jgi:riboflavin biosynthesis pyrimidine reductase
LLYARGDKLFFCVADERRAADKKIEDLSDAISTVCQDAHILVVRLRPEKHCPPEIVVGKKIGIAITYELFSSSDMVNGLTFRNEADNQAIEELLRYFTYQIDEEIRGEAGHTARWGAEDAGVLAEHF